MFIMDWGGEGRMDEAYQGIEEKGSSTLRHLKDSKRRFEIPSESSEEAGEDLVYIL